MERETARIEANEGDNAAVRAVLCLDGIEGCDAGSIPDLGMREVDRDLLGIEGIGEALDEIVARAEEQRPMHGVADGAAVFARRTLDADDMGDAAGEQHHREQDAADNAESEIAGRE